MKTPRERRLERALKGALAFMAGDDPNVCDMCGGEKDGLEFHPECACFPIREALGGKWDSGSHWAVNPGAPVEDWKAEVENDNTRQGYHEWAMDKLEREEG